MSSKRIFTSPSSRIGQSLRGSQFHYQQGYSSSKTIQGKFQKVSQNNTQPSSGFISPKSLGRITNKGLNLMTMASIRGSQNVRGTPSGVNSQALRLTDYQNYTPGVNGIRESVYGSVRDSHYTPEEVLNAPNISVKRVVMNSSQGRVEPGARVPQELGMPAGQFESMIEERGKIFRFLWIFKMWRKQRRRLRLFRMS